MDVVDFNDSAKCLSADYIDSDNIELSVNSIQIEQGINIFDVPALNSLKDSKIGNYSALYLTDKKYGSDIVSFKTISEIPRTKIITYIATTSNADKTPEKYLHIEPGTVGTNSVAAYSFKSPNQIKDINRIFFEIDILSDRYCRVLHRDENRFYYLTVNQDLDFYFADRDYQNTSFNVIDDSVFEYIIDEEGDDVVFYKALSATPAVGNDVKILSFNDNKLTLNTPASAGIILFNNSNRFKIDFVNRYNSITPKLDTSWVSYDIIDSININSSKSSFKERNSYLFSTQYSNATGNELKFNLLPLKDNFSERDNQHRGDYITQYTNKNTPNVDMREYEKIHIGSRQESNNNDISLSYTFYNSDYVFLPDQYTVFTTPKSLYPYSKINVNDTLIAKNGALGGDSPHTSDKIFCKLDQGNANPTDGTYLCTWLSGGDKDTIGVWVDRFYNPTLTSKIEALSSVSVKLFDFTDPSECAIESGNVRDRNYYDRKSSLVFEEDKQYIYERIGNEYVTEYLKHLDQYSLIDKFSLIGADGSRLDSIPTSEDTQLFNLTNAYYTLSNYDAIDKQITISFWLDTDDWSKPVGYSIAGNLTNRGIGILNDTIITPFITLHYQNILHIYNTSFDLIDSIDFKEPIRDIIREDSLDNFYIVTDYQNIFKVQSNGAVFDKASIGIVGEYENYLIKGNKIYFLHDDKTITIFDTVQETFDDTTTVEIPDESGLPQNINSLVYDNVSESLVGSRGDKSVKIDDNNYVFVVDNKTLVKESIDHSKRTVLMSSSTSIKDFVIDDNSYIYVLHDNNKLSKYTKDRLRVYQIEITDSTTNNDELEAIAIDLVREYTSNGLEQYPIAICNNDQQKLYGATINETDGSVVTKQLNDIYGKFYDKCDQFYLDNRRYNLTNYSYLKEEAGSTNTLSFITKLDNIYNNRTSLNSKIEYNIEPLSPGQHHFVYRIDTITGNITVFVDGIKVENVKFEPGKFALQSIFDEGFFIGGTGFNNNVLLGDYLNQNDRYFCQNLFIKQPKIYNYAIDDVDVKFLNLHNIKINEVIASLPSGKRNQIERIQRFFKWQLPGNKSNYINLKIKNNVLTDDALNNTIKGEILREISSSLPASVVVKDITFENY